ncbi:MAG: RtcB family protein [Chlamydiales bacterium]
MSKLKKIAPATYELEQQEGMLVPGLVIATEELLKEVDMEKPLEQVVNVAHLPGIVGRSIAMPDIHWGYGFPIGGVAATDAQHGVISPGGVGYDINCGVRLAIVPIPFHSLDERDKGKLLQTIYHYVPSGVGKGHGKNHSLTDQDYEQVMHQGARWAIEQGMGFEEDLQHCESLGVLEGADLKAVSRQARDRGRTQIGTVGSGNHFVEIGEIGQLYRGDIAEKWGIEKGLTYVLIHSGSRGFGHQICQDTLDQFVSLPMTKELPDRQLCCAPIKSPEGRKYFSAMAAAANFAFNNRQCILHGVRKSFQEVLGTSPESIKLLYDVCHNIAKFETHEFEGEFREVCVHRKGATRAFGPGANELNPIFKKTGQPVLVPGDMGRASHLLVGKGNPLTWCSCCHGAGRARSRHQSMKEWKGRDPVKYMESQGVKVMARSYRTIAEEMPDAYKDVDAVVKAVQEASLADMVAKLFPHLVIKG